MNSDRVVVIGAGLSGLAVAARLVGAGRDVAVLEGSARAGGQISTFREAGLVVELGAEGFIARSRAVPELCQRVGIADSLIDQLTTDTFAVEGDQLLLLPPGEAARRLGFQVPPEELGRGIRSLRLGMGELIDALLLRLGRRVQLEREVRAVRRDGASLVIETQGGESQSAATVVMAAPARLGSALLAPLGLPQCEPLAAAPLMSNVSVNLLYSRSQFESYPAGSGLIFPESFGSVGLRALSLVEHKFVGRVPSGQSLLRVFFRPAADALATWTDARFADEAARAIAQVLPLRGGPQRFWVSRWTDALPVFSPAYQQQAAAADSALQALGVHVAGSAFHGAGLDAAVASAATVAARLGA